MSEPSQTCKTCGRFEIVRLSDRGFPPDRAKGRLVKRCAEAGHQSKPIYLAGIR